MNILNKIKINSYYFTDILEVDRTHNSMNLRALFTYKSLGLLLF